MYKSYVIARYHKRWGLGTYLGFLSGNDINRGALIVAIHECCLSIHLQAIYMDIFQFLEKSSERLDTIHYKI